MLMKEMFTPVKVGNCEIPNRFVATAMVSNLCTEEGYATDAYIKYHEAKAKGGYGLIITEDYAINRNAGGYKYVGALYREDQIEGHKKLTDTVHKYGTKIFCQIYHAGRQSNSHVNGGVQPVCCSPMQCPWNREMARELTIDEIHELVDQFAVTAANVKAAGFDGVELHAGNGYLISAFMSHYENKRTDEYGGCFTNRMRFLREIIEAVRAAIGPDFPLSVRFSAEEHTLSGRFFNEARMVAKCLEEWGVDMINCSNGVYGSFNPSQLSSAYQPHGWTIDNAARLKKVVNIPVLGCNGIDDPIMAESFVEQGFCDLVGMARGSLADPDMPNKAKAEAFEQIRPCVRCLQGCVGSSQQAIPICCTVNPETGRETIYTFEDQPDPKKVLVIGGGPAGLEAAVAAARRGHDVTLWEKSAELGGQFLAAVYPPGKGDYVTFLCYLIQEAERLGVHVVKNQEATEENVRAFDADKVILAVGGTPNKPNIPGIDNPNVFVAEDILRGKAQVVGRLLVAGGGEVGLETAMYLADAERGSITVAEMDRTLAANGMPGKVAEMKKFLMMRGAQFMLNTKVVEFKENGVVLEVDGQQQFFPCSAVVVSMGYHPNNELTAALRDLGDKLVVVGDAVACTNALDAAKSGFDAGYFA